MVKVTREKTENSQVFLTVEMEPVEIEASLAKSYRHLVQRVNIPGFRKGKAPRVILERYLGRQTLLDEALNQMVPEACEKALKEQNIEAIAPPEIEITQTEPAVVFKATVPIAPSVKLGDYHSVKLAPEPAKVSDEDVNAAMEQLRHQQATWEPAERAVDFGDLVTLDVESQIGNASYINQKGIQYHALGERNFPAPGFAEQIVGMKKSEEKEFKLQFPLDYPRGEMAGKEASFKVKVNEIKQEILPELNDEFAQQVGSEFKTLDSLRERVATNLQLRAEEKVRADFEEKVIEAVVNLSQVEFPPVLVEREIQQILEEQSRRFERQGADLGDYLKSINKNPEQLHEELKPVATKRVIQSLVLGKVAEAEKVEVSEAEVDTEVENMLKGATEKKEEWQKALNSPRSRESIKRILLTRKTINRLVEIAKGVESQSPIQVAKPSKKEVEKDD